MKEEQSTLKCWHASQLRRPFSLSSRSGMSAPPLCVWLLPALFYSLPIILRSLSLSFVNYTLSGRIPGICLNHLEFVSSFFHSSALQRYSCGESCGEVQCLCERSLMRSIETLAPSKPSANLKILAGLPRCKHLFCLHLTIYSQG